MGFNYATEKRRFDAEWLKLENEYRAAGFDEDGITAMHEFDLELFNKRRTYETTTQPLPSEVIDADSDKTTLFRRFASLSVGFDENRWSGRYGWIDAIDNPVLVDKLCRLSDSDKELLTLFVYDGYTQAEIARMQGCLQSVISRKLSRLKKYLK